MIRPDDEYRQAAGAEPFWADAWEIDFASSSGDAAVGGFVRLALLPNQGVAWWWTGLLTPRLVAVRDHEVPLPRGAGLEVRADGLWGELVCETPLEHWSLGLEAFGIAYDDPADAWGDEWGERLPVGLDLEWEATAEPGGSSGGAPAAAPGLSPGGSSGGAPAAAPGLSPGGSSGGAPAAAPGLSPGGSSGGAPAASPGVTATAAGLTPAGPLPGPGGIAFAQPGRVHGEILVGPDRIPVTGTGFRSRASGVLDWWSDRPHRRRAWVDAAGAGKVDDGEPEAGRVLGLAPFLVTSPGRPPVRLSRTLWALDGSAGGRGWGELFPA